MPPPLQFARLPQPTLRKARATLAAEETVYETRLDKIYQRSVHTHQCSNIQIQTVSSIRSGAARTTFSEVRRLYPRHSLHGQVCAAKQSASGAPSGEGQALGLTAMLGALAAVALLGAVRAERDGFLSGTLQDLRVC